MQPGVPTPEEFKKQVRVSYGLMAYIFAGGLTIGFGLCGFLFALAEVDGVRADYIHDVDILNQKIEALDKRIDRKIHNHNRDKYAHE